MYAAAPRWLVASFLLMAHLSMAATIQSNGTGGGNWNLGASWAGGTAPLAGDDVVIVAGDAINVTTSPTCNKLTIAGTLSFNTGGQTLTVNSDLVFSGGGSIGGAAAASKTINVNGNFSSLTGADGNIGGINFTINGTTLLNGRIVFTNATGSKTLTGDVTIGNGGAIDFSVGSINLILINNMAMQGTSSLAGNSAGTGTVIGVNSFNVAAGSTATIGRVTMAIIGTTNLSGTITFNNANGSKSFIGPVTIADATIDFTATTSFSCNNTMTFTGSSSIGASSTATGTISTTSTASLPVAAALNLSRVGFTVGNTTTIDGALTIGSNTGAKTLSGDVSVNGTGSIAFTAAATLNLGNNLITSPGSVVGSSAFLGTLNVTGGYSALTGGTSTLNNLKITLTGNFAEAGNAIVQFTGGTNTVTVGGDFTLPATTVFDFTNGTNALLLAGNWNVTSATADPFIEGTSRVTFNGSTGTQTLATTETGGEHFYNLTVSTTSGSSPSLTTSVNINVAHSVTFSSGILNLAGKNLTVTGDATVSTDTYSAGQIITSVAGARYTVTDPSINKSITYSGTGFGDATNGLITSVSSSGSKFNGSYFYGVADFVKTGNATSDCNGGSVFYGPVTFTTVAGADRWRMGANNPDIFYNASFTHNGNNNFIVAWSASGNEFFGTTNITSSTSGGFYVGRNNQGSGSSSVFHGPVIANITLNGNINLGESSVARPHTLTLESTIQLNSTASATGDYSFGSSGAGSVTLTPAAQFIAGSILGASTITLLRVTQNGNALAQTIAAAGTSIISCGNASDGSTFNANVNFTAPQVQLRSSTFNGAVNNFTQTGTVTNSNFGLNSFAAGTSSTFTDQGTGGWRLGNSGADNFNGNVTFIRSAGAGALEPAYTNASNFGGNISTTGTTTAITFGNNSGRVNITGAGARSFDGDIGAPPIVTRLTMNSTGALTLNVPVSITTDLNFTSGVVNTTATNILTMNAGSAVSGTPSNTTHVDGPIQKVGNTAFTFPTGDNGIYRPIAISGITASSTFSAEFFHVGQTLGNSFDPSFYTVSGCEYWTLNRTVGAGNASVTLSWNSPDCTGNYVGDLPTLRVARWTGAVWTTHGNGGTTGNTTNGTIISSGAVTTFGSFALASTSILNPLPVELVDFHLVPQSASVTLIWVTASEVNNDSFEIERSENGSTFESIGSVSGCGTTHLRHNYAFEDALPFDGTSYYRLKQTSFDGSYTYSPVLALVRTDIADWAIYPNPVEHSGTLFMNRTVDISISNNIGQIVLKADHVSQVKVSPLAPGIYLIFTRDGQMRRFIVR